MIRFILRRLLQTIPTLLIVTFVVFFLMNVVGDPARLLLPEDATEADIAALRVTLELDKPLLHRYGSFLVRLARGDTGTSFRYNEPAMPLVLERLPVTLTLAGLSLVLALLIAIPLGVVAAVRRNSLADLIATTTAVAGRSMPNFWLGIMLMLLLAVRWRLLPATGTGSWKHLIMPAITIGTGLAASLTRLLRSSLLEVIRQDYITTARAKGLSERVVIFKHGLRNALIPVITVLGLQMSLLVEGAFITEQVFAIPGMGQLAVKSLATLDFAVVQTAVLLGALVTVISNLAVDLLYTVVDPRIRYG